MAKDEAAGGNSLEELEGIVADCKKKPHNFALLKAKEGVVLKAHPLKSTEVMLRAAKEAGGQPAIAMTGTMIATGKTLEMTLETEEFPASLPKLAKKHFTAMKLPLKITVILPNGQRIEDTDDDGEVVAREGTEVETAEMVSDAAETQGDPDAARKAALTDRIKVVVPQLREAAAKGIAGIDKLGKAVQAAATEMASNSLDRAEKLVDAVEAGLRQLLGPAPGQGAPKVEDEAGLRERLVQEFSGMAGDLRTLLQGVDKAVAGKATQLITMFKAEINTDLRKSGQVLSLLRTMIASAAPKPTDSSQTPSDSSPPPQDGDSKGPVQGDTAGDGDANPFSWLKEKVGSVISGDKEDEKKDEPKPEVKPEKEPEGVVEKVLSVVERIAKAVSDGLGKAAEIVKDNAKLLAIAGDYPEAALAAKEALDAFNETLGGDVEITPTLVSTATKDAAKARDDLEKAQQALKDAEGKWFGREEAVKAAQKTLTEAEEAFRKADAMEKAVTGKKLVNDMLTTGLLAPGVNKKLSGAAALEFIKGAGRDPALTATALEGARTGGHHESVAANLGKVIDLKENGFAHGEERMNAKTSADYAKNLMTMGSTAGPGYFDRMGDYMASGRQFAKSPIDEQDVSSFAELEQKRTMYVGKAMLKEDGTLDLDSQKSKDALGDALFNREALMNPRPALTSHMLKTVDFLKEPTNNSKAGEILRNVEEPNSPNAKALLKQSTGKGFFSSLGKQDVRNSVMASMLKPLDQGPVGSCFATAPVRRMRETDPLGAMGAFAQIAGTGKFKPPFGPEVPAVTNTPPGEDPIMRSFEYSLATSTAQRETSENRKRLKSSTAQALDDLNEKLTQSRIDKIYEGGTGTTEQDKVKEEQKASTLRLDKLKGDVASAFTFVYDPLDAIGLSNDGSSDRGRYIVKRISPEKEIRTKEDFVAAIGDIALSSLGLAKDSPEAKIVLDYAASPKFVDEVVKSSGGEKGNLPWALKGGGQTDEATQTLHGDTLKQNSMTGASGKPLPDESTRTMSVLKGLLAGMDGKGGDMVTIRTVGMHGFNALPNNPSFAKLKDSDPTERDKKIEDNLLKPGRDFRDQKIPLAKALQMFEVELQGLLDNAKTTALQNAYKTGYANNKPTADMTPGELTAAIKKASAAANKIKGDEAAATWRNNEVNGGKSVSVPELRKKEAEMAEAYEKQVTDKLATRMFQDLGGPEIVLADTNWGSGSDHTFFVLCPDPTTGEPLLWTKTIPPGDLHKASRDWIDAEWASID